MKKSILPVHKNFSIVPDSGLQFLDFGFALASHDGHARQFAEKPDDNTSLNVLKIDPERGEPRDVVTGELCAEENLFAVKFVDALEVFKDQWLPAPFLREKSVDADGRAAYEAGPSNWARMRICPLAEPDEDDLTHRVILLMDTALMQNTDSAEYVAPAPSDAEHRVNFSLAHDVMANSWLLNQEWFRKWLWQGFEAGIRRTERRVRIPKRENGSEFSNLPWGYYLTLLSGLAEAIAFPRLRLIDNVSATAEAQGEGAFVDVDLVLDIGNSRTCGVLIEDPGGHSRLLQDSTVLELRDLTLPYLVENKPFPSRVEFRKSDFGDERLSRMSGRRAGFQWPSFLRVGPEAVRLNARRFGNEGLSGLSAPKRYLWDCNAMPHPWIENNADNERQAQESAVYGPQSNFLSANGDVISEQEAPGAPAISPQFSRSSLFTLMLVELVLHARAQINSVDHRTQNKLQDVPRRLRRVILTIPTGTPVRERQLFERRARDARGLILDLLGLRGTAVETELEFIVWIDEATCTQIVYLYAEIFGRYRRSPAEIIDILGGNHQNALRVASLDIGGGTTDLTITTYRATEAGGTLRPSQNFCEGFRRAGDDILRAIVARHVLPAIVKGVRRAGSALGAELVQRWMSESSRSAPMRQKRALFVNQALASIGIAVIEAHETQKLSGNYDKQAAQPRTLHARDILGDVDEELIAYFDQVIFNLAGVHFDIRQMDVLVDASEVEQTFNEVMRPMLAALSRVIHEFNCDVILLSGRPSRLPALKRALLRHLPAGPHQIVSMHDYKVGDWYQFAGPARTISDPKTTVVVGALICALASDRVLANFALDMSQLGAQSTAKVIGPVPGNMIKNNAVLFNDVKDEETTESAPIIVEHPFFLGFRQLDYERWPATPLYEISINPGLSERQRRSLPWKVIFKRPALAETGDDGYRKPRLENIEVDQIEPEVQTSLSIPRDSLQLQFKTMPESEGYWLDTGYIEFHTAENDDDEHEAG